MKYDLTGIFLWCSQGWYFKETWKMYGSLLPSPWHRGVAWRAVQITLPSLLVLLFFKRWDAVTLGAFSLPLGCLGVWLNRPAWLYPQTQKCVPCTLTLLTHGLLSHGVSIMETVKTQIIGAMYCGWSFGNIIISADKAVEISPHSTFSDSQKACQVNPK